MFPDDQFYLPCNLLKISTHFYPKITFEMRKIITNVFFLRCLVVSVV